MPAAAGPYNSTTSPRRSASPSAGMPSDRGAAQALLRYSRAVSSGASVRRPPFILVLLRVGGVMRAPLSAACCARSLCHGEQPVCCFWAAMRRDTAAAVERPVMRLSTPSEKQRYVPCARAPRRSHVITTVLAIGFLSDCFEQSSAPAGTRQGSRMEDGEPA